MPVREKPNQHQSRKVLSRPIPGICLVLMGVAIYSGYRTYSSPNVDWPPQLACYMVILGLLVIIGLRLGPLRLENSHIWFLVVAIVVGHLPRLAALTSARRSPSTMARENFEALWVTYDDLTHALQTFTVALTIITVFILAIPLAPRRNTFDGALLPDHRRLKALILASAALGAVALALGTVLDLASLGQSVVRLPFGLDTVINRTRSNIAPGLALLALFYAIRLGRYERGAIMVLVGLAGGSAFLTTSRGTIFLTALSIMLMYTFAAAGPSRRRGFLIVGVLVLLGLLAFPILSALRGERISGEQHFAWTSGVHGVQYTAERVVTRVQGADGLLFMQREQERARADSLSEKFSGSSLSLGPYYTREIVGVTAPNDFRSPGILGASLLIAGPSLLPFTILLFFSIALAAAHALGNRGVSAVSTVLIAGYMFDLNEGNLSVRPMSFFVLTVLFLAAAHRVITNQTVRR
jgi:hypothetical protein